MGKKLTYPKLYFFWEMGTSRVGLKIIKKMCFLLVPCPLTYTDSYLEKVKNGGKKMATKQDVLN